MPNGCSFQYKFPERSIVWSIAETTWNYGNDLSPRLHEFNSKRYKCRVKIYSFNTHLSKKKSMARKAVNFFIRWIQY